MKGIAKGNFHCSLGLAGLPPRVKSNFPFANQYSNAAHVAQLS
jgi:hypothetical protein